jgi:hypothetical protein
VLMTAVDADMTTTCRWNDSVIAQQHLPVGVGVLVDVTNSRVRSFRADHAVAGQLECRG